MVLLQDFSSQFIVNMSSTSTGDLLDDGPEVVMRDGIIRQGTAGIGIANDRGLLAVSNLAITEMIMTSGIRTDNGGLSSIEGLAVTASSIPVSLPLSSSSRLSARKVLPSFANMVPELDGSCNICAEHAFR